MLKVTKIYEKRSMKLGCRDVKFTTNVEAYL